MVPAGVPEEVTLCGQPVTISQCKFQAYIARVNTVAEARAVCKSVSEQTERDAAFSEFVCPFAYRLACAGGRQSSAAAQSDESPAAAAADGSPAADRSPTAGAAAAAGAEAAPPAGAAAAAAAASPEKDDEGGDEKEGYCDNGDVGSGEKLLYLLQKWDIRDRVLVVTRINGGFVKAELLGVRRYRFVIDRAKKLLENSELASLRRAVDADVNPLTTIESNSTLATQEGADVRRLSPTPRNSLQEGADAAGDGWDRFVLPVSAQRRISGHAGGRSLLGAPPASGGVMSPWGTTTAGGSRGRGELRGSVSVSANAKHSSAAHGVGGACWFDAGSSAGAPERRALSLAQLSISSKTVAFPPGHVPSVLGARGHGKKRGRINHFAVRTPPTTSGRDNGNGNGNSSGGGGISEGGGKSAPDPNDDSDVDAPLQVCATSAWSLPHQLDPTSAVTDLGAPYGDNGAATKGGGKKGAAASRSSFEPITDSPSNPMLSRASSCATINSPSRVSAIMLGMATGISKDHTLHPPPPAAAAYANRYSLRKGKRVPAGLLANSHNGVVDLSFAGSSLGGSVVSCSDTSDEYSPIRVGLRRHRQQPSTRNVLGYYNLHGGQQQQQQQQLRVSPHPPAGSGEATNATAAGYGTGAGGLLHDGDLLESCCSHALPPGRCGGGGSGSGNGGGGGGGNTDDNSHPGLSLPVLRQTPGTVVRDEPYQMMIAGGGGSATELLGSSASVGGWKNNDDDRSISTTSGIESLDEPSHCRPPGGERAALAGEGEGRPRQRQCDSPDWSLGDAATGRTAAASGFSEVAVSRGESGLRGWTAGRAVPAPHRA